MLSKAQQKVAPGCVTLGHLVRGFAAICVALLVSVAAHSQGNTGRILGVVTDQSGGNVAGAAVTITDVARGVSQTLTTDSDGAYVALSLLPGTYTVRAEFKGFKVFERKNILVEVGKDVRIDPVLQTGSATETITITEDVPMVDTSSTTLGGTISNEIINDLPLNGRNYQNLISLRPGTAVYPGGGPWTQTTNGIRPEDTSFIVDGITNDEAFMGLSVTNAAAVLGDAATLIPIDAIQEFNTQVNPKAEFGWKPGAITSVGLKSGTNQVHGTAYAFGRSDSFDARNYFDPVGTPKTPVELEQFGVTGGGHVIKDKLFYFGAFEAQRYTVGNALPGHVPTTASVTGGGANGCQSAAMIAAGSGDCTVSIADATTDLKNLNPSFTVNPLSNYLLGFYTPNSGQGTFVSLNFPNENSSKNAIGKIDYHINDHNAFSGSYFFGNDTIVGMDFFELLAQFRTKVHSRAQTVAGHWAWTPSSTWANEFRAGFTHYVLQILPDDLTFPYKINTGISNPLLSGIPDVRVGLGGGFFSQLGAFHNFPKIVGPDKVYDFIDQVSYLRGKHAFKFGAEFRDDLVHQATFRAGRGRIKFADLESFLAGTPGNTTFLAGDPTRNIKQGLYSGYAQDDWRITPRITLNLGFRYEYQAVPSEDKNLFGNFEPSVGLEQVGRNISSIYKGDHKNFSPRFGVAWDVTGKGTTIVRLGGSIVYDLLSMSTFMSQQNTQNTVTLGVGTVPAGATIITCPLSCQTTTGVPIVTNPVGNLVTTGITIPGSSLTWKDQTTAIYPSSVTGLVQCGDGNTPLGSTTPDPGPCDTFAMNRNFHTPYVENWTLGIQRAFSGKLGLDVTYVGNHGVKLPGVVDLNQPDLATGVKPFGSQFSYLGFINYLSNFYGSTYHGLQTTLTARNYHGLDFVAGYTYSHALDDMSSNWVAFLPQDSAHPLLDHGSSDEDIRHRLTLSVTYSLPERKTKSQLLEGWQLNTIISLQSGQPWNANDQANGFSGTGELSDRWDFFGKPSDFKSIGPNGIPCFGPGGGGACTGATVPAACLSAAASVGPAAVTSLTDPNIGTNFCYMVGSSLLIPNGVGQFGTMGRNIFRDTGFHNVDLSISKSFKFGERIKAQFRVETFNILNHPNFANPNGATSGYGQGATADPSQAGSFGCGCSTPDNASFNPVLGSGSNRAIQLGLKFIF
ncbi:MAG TPA: TonB-dependent receptor [Candidatus Acidoferrum sp.]|nr:TonB-dependent receptor [Candidatus Acidoferrum sp.]